MGQILPTVVKALLDFESHMHVISITILGPIPRVRGGPEITDSEPVSADTAIRDEAGRDVVHLDLKEKQKSWAQKPYYTLTLAILEPHTGLPDRFFPLACIATRKRCES
jgi:hypothetical protein